MMARFKEAEDRSVSPLKFDALAREHRQLQERYEELLARGEDLERGGSAGSAEEEPNDGMCDFCEAVADGPGFVRSYEVCEDCWSKLNGSCG